MNEMGEGTARSSEPNVLGSLARSGLPPNSLVHIHFQLWTVGLAGLPTREARLEGIADFRTRRSGNER